MSVCCLFCQQDYKKIKKILYWTDFLQTHINFWCRPRWRDGSRIVFFNTAVWTVFCLGGGTWSKQNRDLILRPPKHAVKHSNIYSSDNDPKIKEQAQNRLTACQNICIFIQIYVRFDTFWGFLYKREQWNWINIVFGFLNQQLNDINEMLKALTTHWVIALK